MPDESLISRRATPSSRTAQPTSGVEDYKEFWYSLVGLAGIGQSFDGNGTFAKFLVGNSGQTLKSRSHVDSSARTLKPGQQLLARSPLPPQGTRPAYPARSRPTSRSCPATRRRCPNFNGPLSQGPADGSG